MCGIAGFCSTKVNNKHVIREMTSRMIHRGPDASDIYVDENTGVTFGHRRLSIVDLTDTGSQPMTSKDERFVIVYNGEIYNASEIRQKLIDDGKIVSFRGTSDTEALLEAIAVYGIKEALVMTKGMFALAVYDKQDRTITIARDRVGEKPLYYGHINGEFVFASDIDVLRAYPNWKPEIDTVAVERYLRYSYVPAPMSIYKGISKLMPGHYMTFAYPYAEGVDEVYYDLAAEYAEGAANPFKGTIEDATDALDETLKAAVKSQLMSDVPLGAFLSGGIDSATVVALMQSLGDSPVKTFTIGFDEKAYDESDAAAEIAKHLGTDHTCLMLSETQLKNVVPKMADIFTEPFADSSQIPTYLVSKLARSKVTVSLSGDAGDELFGGYNTYWKVANLYNQIKPVPGVFKKLTGKMGKNHKDNTLYRMANCLLAEDIANLHEAVCYDNSNLAPKHIHQDMILPGSARIEDEMMLRDLLAYHPDDILVKVDRAGMAVSLENRVPMLDKDVLKLAFSLPVDYKIGNNNGAITSKKVLKEVLYRYVPKELMDRPKKGFSVPLTRWLKSGEIHDMAWDMLSNSYLVRDGILDGKMVETLMKLFVTKGINTSLLWNVIVLEQWYRKYHA